MAVETCPHANDCDKMVEIINRQDETIGDLVAVLTDAYPLVIGWASHWQFDHKSPAFHPTHQGIVDRITAVLAKAEAAQ